MHRAPLRLAKSINPATGVDVAARADGHEDVAGPGSFEDVIHPEGHLIEPNDVRSHPVMLA